MSSALKIQNLSVSLSGNRILNEVNLTIEEGSFSVLVGANGSGKSTLIKSICGLQKFKGSVELFGKDLKKVNRNIIGYIPQNNISEKNLPVSVFQAVSIGRYAKNGIFKTFNDNDKRIVNNAMRTAQIEHIQDSPAGKISGGEAQKVSIARVLAQQPEIILLDEPQSNLDPNSQKTFLNLIEKLYSNFKFTCLMVTHDMELIPECCSKVFMLKDGKIALETENKDIKNKMEKYGIFR